MINDTTATTPLLLYHYGTTRLLQKTHSTIQHANWHTSWRSKQLHPTTTQQTPVVEWLRIKHCGKRLSIVSSSVRQWALRDMTFPLSRNGTTLNIMLNITKVSARQYSSKLLCRNTSRRRLCCCQGQSLMQILVNRAFETESVCTRGESRCLFPKTLEFLSAAMLFTYILFLSQHPDSAPETANRESGNPFLCTGSHGWLNSRGVQIS